MSGAARVRLAVKAVTPPLLWSALKRVKDARRPGGVVEAPATSDPELPEAPPEWEYVPDGWSRARVDAAVKGWDVEGVVAAYRRKWPSFLRALEGPGPLGIAHEVPEGVEVPREERGAHNTIVSFAYVLALAARQRERISVLDWGGGPGHYFLIARSAVPDLELEYHSKDVARLAALGRELLPEVTFHDDDGCLARRYDLVLASGSLQYAEDWSDLLRRLADATAGHLYVTRLPVALAHPSFVVVQRPYAYGYDTEYLGWVVARDELLRAAADAGLALVREFVLADVAWPAGAPETPVEHRGYLFRRRS